MCLPHRRILRAALLLFALAWLGPAVPAQPGEGTLRVGSKRFTESYILAELLAQTAAPHTASPPVVRQGLGNTAIVYEALRSGAIDLYAEYTGTIALEILKGSPAETREAMNAALAPLGLGVAIPLGFNDGYALAVRAADAERLGLRTLSDLARHPELKLGLSNEFIGRADGWKGLAARYGFTQTPTGLDHGLAYEAVAAKQIDAMDIYTTDAKIEHLGLRVLEDDKKYFPRYDAVVLYKLDLPSRLPKAWAALQALEGRIDERAMIAMMLVAISVGIAILIGVPLAILVFAHVRLRALVLGIASILQTVPSLALLAVLISLLGAIGALPALIALTLYSLLPIMRNTVTGLAEVPHGLRMAGTALGMTPPQSLRLVLLPLALPTLLAGVRTATAIAIGTATIAAFIGAGGFGERIVTGLALNDRELLLAGALPAAALALLSEGIFELIELAMRRRRRTG
jgi:osmoprotectant transport system permease protein